MNAVSIGKGEGTGRSHVLRPVLVVLLATVLVPSACTLWFMYAAVQEVSLASRQRLADAYDGAVRGAAARLQDYCSARIASLSAGGDPSPTKAFDRLVLARAADAVIVRDGAGRLLYPSPQVPSGQARAMSQAWQSAEDLEHAQADGLAAAAAYARIADTAPNADLRAQAMLAQARCLAKAGQKDQAVAILRALAENPDLQAARGAQGRLVTPNAVLFALQLINRPEDDQFRKLAAGLVKRLNDYEEPAMPPSQRRFLMAALWEMDNSLPPFATLAAENLAAEYLSRPQPAPQPSQLTPTSLPGVWQAAGPGGTVVGLFRQDLLLANMHSAIRADAPRGVSLFIRPPTGEPTTRQRAFVTLPAGAALPGWTVEVLLTGDDPFAVAARQRKAAILWTAAVGIMMILALAAVLSYYLSRQVRLTRLKNDLIATVSHELKTPLASMRLLIDTLLERRYGAQEQAEEYLALIAKENERLSRLIDNFLNFSRMERRKTAFVFAALPADELVAAVMRAVPDRVTQPPCHFELDAAKDCPAVRGDRDALVTVVLNLLDNAYKYSHDPRRIALRVFGQEGRLHLEVRDNGIGLSRRSVRRVFRRFYQVDRSLSRSVGGCGLGLSIVKFIIDAHGGTVDVSSRLGQGSTFTVTLPGLEDGAGHAGHDES